MAARKSRSLYSTKNIITGIGGQIINIVLGFVARTFFINALGQEYLGVSSLFTTILTMLNISELGISTAIVFSLYKPLAEKDYEKCQILLKLLKKIYAVIGIVVLGIGLSIMPFLPYIIKGNTEVANIKVIYIIYLLQSALSYWFYSYKNTILQADQRQYVATLVGYFITLSVHLLQISVLLLVQYTNLIKAQTGFVVYLIVNLVFVVVKNIVISKRVDKLYPHLSDRELARQTQELNEEEKRSIFKNVIGLACYKISNVTLSSADSIIISSYINVAAVGIYSNYVLILNIVITLVGIVFGAFTAGIGNLYVTESKEKSEFIFRCLNLLNFWVYGACGICFFYLVNPFIRLWVGEDYLFPIAVVVVIVANFLTDGLQNAVISYKDACGLFWEGKFRPIASALLNVVVSLIMVRYLGIAGVILGTIISRFLTTWWFDALLVHKRAFNKSPAGYYFRYLRYLAIIVATALIVYPVANMIEVTNLILWMVKGIVCFFIPNVVFLTIFRNTEEFRYIKLIGKDLLTHIFKR
ncbi:MAG TPA: sugar translocase [Clostridiaceae bacterium]|jgi:O-antigen/teichoic acid export membrane protein|nr:sugar translocase [Clostridiaceae bacterium]